jgi:hypothetical protein
LVTTLGHLVKAIEVEATVEHHTIRVPTSIPEGSRVRVLFLMEDTSGQATEGVDLKRLLAGLTEGLTTEDLHRPRDLGRGDAEWPS